MKVSKVLKVLLFGVIVFACEPNKKDPSTEQAVESTSSTPISSEHNATCRDFESMTSGVKIGDVTGTKRIATSLIDSFVESYPRKKIINDSLIGMNECNGEQIRAICHANGLLEVGSFHYIYARSYNFSGDFNSFFGVTKGIGKDSVMMLLGQPVNSNENVLVYVSETPENDEAELFIARWIIYVIIEMGKTTGIRLVPNSNDC